MQSAISSWQFFHDFSADFQVNLSRHQMKSTEKVITQKSLDALFYLWTGFRSSIGNVLPVVFSRDFFSNVFITMKNSKVASPLFFWANIVFQNFPKFLSCSSHIRSVLIGVKYWNCRTLDFYSLFAILLGQIKSKVNYRLVTYKLASPRFIIKSCL